MTDLPEPELADDAENLAATKCQVNATDRLQLGSPHAKVGGKVVHLEQRRLGREASAHELALSRSLGSVRSRRPSPSRFKPNSPNEIKRPASVSTHGP